MTGRIEDELNRYEVPMRSPICTMVLSICALVFAACQPSPTSPTAEAVKEPGKSAAKKANPEPQKITVPAGTALAVRLEQAIHTGKTTEGTPFEGSLSSPIVVDGVEVAPAHSRVAGKVTHAVSSGRLKRPAELGLELTSLTLPDGKSIPISSNTWSMKGKSHKKRNMALIGGGAGVGAAIGAIAGGGKGALIGAAAGGGAGTATAFATGKDEIKLPVETKLNFKLASPIEVTRPAEAKEAKTSRPAA
jgi:hypothetical protein